MIVALNGQTALDVAGQAILYDTLKDDIWEKFLAPQIVIPQGA